MVSLPAQEVYRAGLRAMLSADEAITRALTDALGDITRELSRLQGRQGIAAEIRRAQLSAIRAAIRKSLEEHWRAVNTAIREAGPTVASSAASVQHSLDQALYFASRASLPAELRAAEEAYARSTVTNYFARGLNDVPLSQRVYRTKALANGWVDRAINRVLLKGGSWQELARAVRGMINPDVPGGVSYASKRLARTELNNAFHTAQAGLAEQNPWTAGVRWHLSRSHPKRDRCDDLAGKLYAPRRVPPRPHPQCLCVLIPETISEEAFMDRLLAGNYRDVSENFLGRSAA